MDQELVEFLETRFRSMSEQISGHVSEQISGLRGEIQELRSETSGQIQGLRGEIQDLRGEVQDLRGEFQEFREETNQRFERVDQSFEQVNQRFERVETDVRQNYVMLEALRGEVQLVAEGVATVNQRLDRTREELSREIKESRALTNIWFGNLSPRVDNLETRVSVLERQPRASSSGS